MRTVFNLIPYRVRIQITSLILLNMPFLSSWGKYACVPALHCYSCPLATFACPIGSMQFFIIVGMIPFIALGVLLLAGVLFGKLLCFYVCPFGFMQDIAFRLHRASFPFPRILEYGKYGMLIGVVVIATYITKHPMFCKLCPAGILEGGVPIILHALIFEPDIVLGQGALEMVFPNPLLEMLSIRFFLKLSGALLVIVAAVVFRRPFCRAVCPAGAFFSLCARVTQRKRSSCRVCQTQREQRDA